MLVRTVVVQELLHEHVHWPVVEVALDEGVLVFNLGEGEQIMNDLRSDERFDIQKPLPSQPPLSPGLLAVDPC